MFIIQFLRDWKYHRIKNTIAKLYRYPRYHLFISVYIFEFHQRNELKKKKLDDTQKYSKQEYFWTINALTNSNYIIAQIVSPNYIVFEKKER